VADDDRETRSMIGAHLRHAGLDVFEVADGAALVALVERLGATGRAGMVVVTDVEMPVMNGLSALRRIRRGTPEVAVIVVTGVGDESVQQSAWRLGAAAVFQKPVDLDLLRDTALALAPRAKRVRGAEGRSPDLD
jgi:CheY-like chemotaxis protein